MMPSIRQIEAFRAVMLTRSMTQAAAMLSVTQSAVSKIMKEFEAVIGFPLFVRRQGGLEPSAEAAALFGEVERVFLGVERVERAAARIRARHTGQLRVVAMSSITGLFMARVVKAFVAERPGVQVTIETYNSPEVVDVVASGQCELGYAVAPVSDEAVASRQLYRTALVCVLPPGHRLRRRRTIALEDLAGEDFISLLGWNTTRLATDAAFRAANIARRERLEAGWSGAVGSLVAEGLGVAIIDPFTAELAARCGCVVRPLAQPIEFTFAALRAKRAAPNALVDAFGATFDAQFRMYGECAR
jgi:DNA-binding transcriptional LysR family regulator